MSRRDCWAEWLAERRHGGDEDAKKQGLEELWRFRDRVLDSVGLSGGETVLDVGCGEGLIAFGALERGAARVMFSDISVDLLDFCREAAADLGVLDRCDFIHASADDLHPVEDESVDVVTTRSVLIYVRDKARAFHEFARVLRPGGRVSLLEPINRFALTNAETWLGYDLAPVSDLGRKVRAVYQAIQPPGSDTMLDFDERDLLRFAEDAGFFPIRMEVEADIAPAQPRSWDVMLRSAGNPRIPTFGEALEQALTPDERDRFSAYLRPLVEEGAGIWRMAMVLISAVKPERAGLH